MVEQLKPFLSRFLAAWLPGILTWAGAKLGFNISAEMVQAAVEMSVFLAIYAVSHRLLSKGTNPGDAATTQLVEREKVLNQRAKSTNYPE